MFCVALFYTFSVPKVLHSCLMFTHPSCARAKFCGKFTCEPDENGNETSKHMDAQLTVLLFLAQPSTFFFLDFKLSQITYMDHLPITDTTEWCEPHFYTLPSMHCSSRWVSQTRLVRLPLPVSRPPPLNTHGCRLFHTGAFGELHLSIRPCESSQHLKPHEILTQTGAGHPHGSMPHGEWAAFGKGNPGFWNLPCLPYKQVLI